MWEIVVVEDEDLLRQGLVRTIPWGKYHFRVVGEADNGRDGLRLVRGARPDVVITDIRMPVMDGLDMAEQIYHWDPGIRIVFISGYDEFEYARRAMKVAARDYILKPVKLAQVEEILETLDRELEEERNTQREYEALQQLQQSEKTGFRSQLLELLVSGNVDDVYEQKLLKLMGTQKAEQYYGVMIVMEKGLPVLSLDVDYLQIQQMDMMLERRIMRDNKSDHRSIMRGSSLCERILAFYSDDREMLQREIRSTADHLETRVPGETDCLCAVSSVRRGIMSFRESFREAMSVSREIYLEVWSKQFSGSGHEEETASFISYDKEPLLHAVRTGNTEQVKHLCGQLNELLLQTPAVSHAETVMLITSIFDKMISITEPEEGQKEDRKKKDSARLKQILSGGRRKTILDEFGRYCLQVCAENHDMENGLRDAAGGENIRAILKYIDIHYAEFDLKLSTVAKHMFVSPSGLTILIKRYTGKTFVEYLTDVRMEHAKRLLQNTDLRAYEVSEKCGFANATYFSTVFKNIYGISPKSYQKKYKKQIISNEIRGEI